MSARPAFAGADLSLRRDLTSVVTVVREAPTRPGAFDHLVVRSILTWDPKASPTKEVDFAEVRAALERLPRRFPGLKSITVDAGAESSSVLPWCRQHPRLSLLVQPFTATAETNMALWGALVARLNARTISFPRHERLLSELRGLRSESFSFGSKWRVVDGSRRFHRDVSFALALAVLAAGSARTCTSPLCDDVECDGRGGFELLGSPEAREWDSRHPDADEWAERERAGAAVDAEDAALDADDEADVAVLPERAEDVMAGIGARLKQMAAEGFSAFTRRRAAREARTEDQETRVARQIAAWRAEQTAAEAAAQQEADRRDLERRVRRGGNVYFPGKDD